MVKGTTADFKAAGFIDHIHRAPYLGIVAFMVVLLWKPAAHLTAVTLHAILSGGALYFGAGLIGFLGFALVWKGHKRDELTATCMGFLGGALLWMGWFEHSFRFFGDLLNIEPVMYEGHPLLGPENQLIESSTVLYFAVLIFLAANKETRCRMMMWFHRNLRLRPDTPTPGYKRQFARITAMEVLFINWFFHIVNITLSDPRIFGPVHPVRYAVFFGFLIWGIYLLSFKLLKYRSMAGAIRYSVATVGILWVCVEMAAQWKWYAEVWVRPGEFPILNGALLSMFAIAALLANLTPRRGEQIEAA